MSREDDASRDVMLAVRTAPITLTADEIDAALPLVNCSLGQYTWLQERRDVKDLRSDAEFRKRFNAFYRIRRGTLWQDRFYDILERQKKLPVSFGQVLASLHDATGRYEASFTSKLVATIDPHLPVIDSVVLQNLNLRLPAYNSKQRASRIEELHSCLVTSFGTFLMTAGGRHLVQRFREEYPDATITETKMLDFVLWRTRRKTGAP